MIWIASWAFWSFQEGKWEIESAAPTEYSKDRMMAIPRAIETDKTTDQMRAEKKATDLVFPKVSWMENEKGSVPSSQKVHPSELEHW